MRKLKLRFAGVFVSLIFAIDGQAYAQQPMPTVSFSESLTLLAKTCGQDIDTNCAGVNLGNNRLKNCLSRNQAILTPACRDTYGRVFNLIDKRAQSRNQLLKQCDADAKKLCAAVQKDDGAVIDCLRSAKRLGWRCSQAMTEANFR
jgi:hypothetical protein